MCYPKNLFRLFIILMVISCQEQKGEEHRRPNILIAIADDLSFPHMGAYGTDWIQSPAFDRVANEGLLFTRAYTPNAKCSPSRSIILTGRNSWQLEEAANHVPDFPSKFLSHVEVLGENGYFTGFTGKGWAPGNPGERNGKPRMLTGTRYSEVTTDPPTDQISRVDYAGNFRQFLDEKPEDKPFYFWYGSTEPHRAYAYGSGVELGGKTLDMIDEVPAFWPDTDSVRNDLLDYAFETEYFDQHLLRMLEELENRGELDNTLVVVTADNGMPFPRVKGQAYELSNHLPLAIMWGKGIQHPGRVIADFVSFADFAPTFLELAEVDPDSAGVAAMSGKSLLPLFDTEASGKTDPARSSVLIGKERHDIGRPDDQGYPIRGIVTEDFTYIRNFEPSRWPAGNPETGYLNTDGGATKTVILNQRRVSGEKYYWNLSFGKRSSEELYDRKKDPLCINNLALHPEYQNIKDKLALQMENELRAQDDPRMFGNGEVFDNYEYAQESQRNFYSRFMQGEEFNTGWVNDSDYEKYFKE
ncbi:Arylsulfatase A [Cyclobacterium lianum]|uniref:Arylsulfatase A n=1 Tax=Cyclobacterium lianum TaxID=388280 RepID=A0A1M7LCL4_9BACT|nr:sulfatase [Cyclobacterium lianum]SHM75848.1 Arylsulfatase A [Cyclobacterium lianum]